MSATVNRSWLALNETRPYPLAPWATRTDLTGAFTLPDDLLVELVWPFSPGARLDPSLMYLSNVVSSPAGYAVSIGYAGPPALPVVATASIAASALAGAEFTPCALAGAGAFADATGRVVFGSVAGAALQPPGSFAFDLAGAPLDIDCLRPATAGVSAIYVQNGQELLGPFQGDVVFAIGENMRLDAGPSGIALGAVPGAGASACLCGPSAAPGPAIASINGVPTTAAFSIIGGDCVAVTPVSGGLALSNPCSSPCCGPEELAALLAELQALQGAVGDLRQFVTALQASQASMAQNVLGSKIGDQGCVSCG